MQSVHALLRGGGIDAMASVGLGEHEVALEKLDAIMAVARELGAGATRTSPTTSRSSSASW